MPIITTKKAITSSITCPAIILAARRTPKLTGLTQYEKNSKTNIKGASHHGVPEGINIAKNLNPFLAIVIKTHARNTNNAIVKVIEIWLV